MKYTDLGQKEKKRHTKALTISLIVMVLIVFVGSFGFFLYKNVKQGVNATYEKTKNSKTFKSSEFNGKRPFNVLLIGTDTGDFGRTEKLGRSDTLMIASVRKNSVQLMSIPRDTLALVNDKTGQMEKINAAYSQNGAAGSTVAVSKLLNVPIDSYVAINFKGMERLINSVHGVKIKPLLTFDYEGYHFDKNKTYHMDGKMALAYSRMRYDDPQGDYGRTLRQRQLVTELIKQNANKNIVNHLGGIINNLGSSMRTDLDFNSLAAIMLNYRKASNHITNDYLHGKSCYIGESSYQVISDSELQRTSDIVRKQLNLPSEKISNEETQQNKLNKNFDWNSGDDHQQYKIYDLNKENTDNE